ncbi:MAG: hypothetical protein ACFB0C_10700 [Leptolyngbyaceae cyanobacterium]
MTDILDPFLSPFQNHPDHSYADAKAEAIATADRNDLIIEVLEGDADIDDYLEMLYEHQIDPIGWMNQTAQQLERVVDSGVCYLQNENGLYLPL